MMKNNIKMCYAIMIRRHLFINLLFYLVIFYCIVFISGGSLVTLSPRIGGGVAVYKLYLNKGISGYNDHWVSSASLANIRDCYEECVTKNVCTFFQLVKYFIL